jgi:hypothetical protein
MGRARGEGLGGRDPGEDAAVLRSSAPADGVRAEPREVSRASTTHDLGIARHE